MSEDTIAAVKRRVEAELRQKAADDVLVARLRGTCARFALRPSCPFPLSCLGGERLNPHP